MSRARDSADLSTGIDVDSSGNVGIGTSSPSFKQHTVVSGATGDIAGFGLSDNASNPLLLIKGDATNQTLTFRAGSNTGTYPAITFDMGTTGEAMRIDSSGDLLLGPAAAGTTQRLFAGTGTSAGQGLAGFVWSYDDRSTLGLQIRTDEAFSSSYPITFSTTGSSDMTLDSSGRLLMGATTYADTISGNENAVCLFGDAGQRIFSRDDTNPRYQMQFYNPNGSVGRIETSGSSTSYVTSSDYRLKTDAQPMTGASARVQALNPVNFEWIADGTRVDGFLAHEAQEVVPEAVSGTKDAMMDEEYEVTPAVEATYDDDGNELTAAVEAVMGTRSVPDYQGIDQSKLVPLLTAALQEALTEISSLKTRVEALEAN